jgi:hypothetical protein
LIQFSSSLRRRVLSAAAMAAAAGALVPATAAAHGGRQSHDGFGPGATPLIPGNLLVSTSSYSEADIQPGVTPLPTGCTTGCVPATADGAYPYVFNNDLIDPSFGVAAPIVLDQITPSGRPISSEDVPENDLVTSFSSKSELALNLSTSGRQISFMGYAAPINGIDISNSNTPGAPDPTNPVGTSFDRAVAALNPFGQLSFTETNAYSGNNGRAAVINDSGRRAVIYTAGNAGNGSNPQPTGVVLGAGAQIMNQSSEPERLQSPTAPTPVASFSVTELGDKADKVGKDDNFRGETVFDNVLYYTKGSGSNGVNTVYFVDTTGKACPGGVGVPQPGAPLPTAPLSFNPATVSTTGLPSNMCILRGFPTELAKTSTSFPFGLWFANPHTLYVADEGDGDTTFSATSGTYTSAAASTSAGLQKWVFDTSTQSWKLAYTLQSGLSLGTPYKVAGYPIGDNAATGEPWAPATDGLRNLTGDVNPNGSVTLYAVTSTVSGSGDPGADPNQLVKITDSPSATAPSAGEQFSPVIAPAYAQVVRGVTLTPGSPFGRAPFAARRRGRSHRS